MQETLSELVRRRLKELNYSKAELAAATRLSRTYITDIANGTGNTQSGQYRPSPEVVSRLSEVLKVPEMEILAAIGYTSENLINNIPAEIKALFQDSNGWSQKKRRRVFKHLELLVSEEDEEGEEFESQ